MRLIQLWPKQHPPRPFYILYIVSWILPTTKRHSAGRSGIYFSEAMLLHWHWVDTLTGQRNSFQMFPTHARKPLCFQEQARKPHDRDMQYVEHKGICCSSHEQKFITTVCAVAQWGLLRFPADFVRAPVGQKENRTPFPWDHHCRSVSS